MAWHALSMWYSLLESLSVASSASALPTHHTVFTQQHSLRQTNPSVKRSQEIVDKEQTFGIKTG